MHQQDCGHCDYDVFYHFESENNGQLRRVFFSAPSGCVLAAIRDEESRRGAQYAIPPGEIAMTQGYFEIDEYIDECHFDDEKEEDGEVTGCKDHYNEYFVNFEGSDVPDDAHCWVDIDFPIPDGVIHAAIGADGLLRPVKQWSYDVDNFGYTGAVYECCPEDEDVCNVVDESSDEERRGRRDRY